MANAAAMLGIALAASAAAAPTLPVEVHLENVLWQALPDEVLSVLRGPDDRMWYQIASDGAQDDAEAVKRSIEHEFRRPSPQVVGARPGLFEPGGRVWFITQSGYRLMGYDGDAWIERDAGPCGTFRGALPTGPVPANRGVNAFVDGRAFFPQWRGITWFDGRQWSYKPWPMEGGQRWLEWWLMPEPDGRGVLAVLEYADWKTLWRWRDDRWTELALPVTSRRDPLKGVAPGPGGSIWVLTQAGQLYELGHAPDPTVGVGELVKALGASDYAAREAAQAALVGKGTAIRALLEQRLAVERAPEIRYRLQSVLPKLKDEAGPPGVLGSCRFAAAMSLASDLAGGLVVYATEIEEGGRKHKQGLILMDASGTCRVLETSEALSAWTGEHNVLNRIRAPGGVWVPGLRMEGAQLFDSETGRRLAGVPDHRYAWVQAVAPDGTAFVSVWPRSTPVVALRLGAPDTRKLLAPVCERKLKGGFFFAADAGGTAWLYHQDSGLERFEGRQWQAVTFPEPIMDSACLITGGAGVALLVGEKGAVLVDGDRRAVFPSLTHVLEQETAELAKAFPAYRSRGYYSEAWGLVGDRAGNLWVLRDRTVKVRTGGRWLDAREALVRAGSSKGEIHGLATMEDGRRVYAYETSSETGQWAHAFIGELRDGEPAFYRAHLGGSPGDTWMPIKRDTDGCLWAPAQESVDWWSGGWSNRQFAVCIGRAGIEVINGAGWPVLCDLGGNTWLKRTFGQEWSDEFDLRHHDGPGGKVRVPTGDPHTRLMSDGPGSVYAWTDYGLCHMVADAPARPAAFALKEVVIPTGFEGTVMQVTYIQPGAILVETLLPSDAGTGLYVYPRP